jgi:sugar/nucleoside kinase (ribokinase family)
VVAVGKLVGDVVLRLSAELVRGGQVRVHRTLTAGGAPANVTAGLARLGVPARLAGWAGADPLSDGLLDGLRARGVEVAVARRGSAPVGTVLVHPDGERTLLADAGEGGLELGDLAAAWFAAAAVVHLDGYDLLPGRWPEVAVAAAERAHDAGAAVSVDVAAANRMEAFGGNAYAGLLRRLRPDLLLCNARETAVLGDVADLARLVVVHAGSEPTRVLAAGADLEVPVPSADVVDTTGAGDAFAAGLLAGWHGGLSVREAVERGHAAAADVVTVPGAQPPP